MTKTKFIIAALSTALLIGCGGSAGVGSGFPAPPVDPGLVPTGPGLDGGSVLRTYKAGDTWTYTLGGNMLRQDYDDQQKLKTSTSGPVTGTMIRQVSSVTFQGAPAFKFTDTMTYSINGGQNTVEILETYAKQEIDGSITMLGRRDNNADCGNVTKTWRPGTFAAGSNVGSEAKFTGIDVVNDFYQTSTAFTATNSSTVTASTGAAFNTWRTVYADSYEHNWDFITRFTNNTEFVGEGYRIKTVEAISSTDDWSPLWGAPVQRGYQTTRTDSVLDSITISNGTVTYTYHIEKRSLNLKMVLASHSLQ